MSIPRHIAIIMDGNGRWAKARGLSRTEGHKEGAKAALRAIEAARDAGVSYVTLFSFSSENWSRPQAEIDDLMSLLRFYLQKETAEMHKSGARLLFIGDRAKLSADIVRLMEQAEDVTKNNTKITVVVALNYGGRQDIISAAKELVRQAEKGEIRADQVDEVIFSSALMTHDVPDPDLVIRTSGECRISNFLLWQMAYAELFFMDVLWPDFTKQDMEQAIHFYSGRDRRYGGLSEKAVTV